MDSSIVEIKMKIASLPYWKQAGVTKADICHAW
jgi:hypothetical protein